MSDADDGPGVAAFPAQPRMSGARPDKRRDRTRAALLRSAETLLARKPLGELSIDELIAAADVAKATFYNHFVDKEDLARALVEGLRIELRETILAGIAGVEDPARRVSRALCIAICFRREHRHRSTLLARSEILGISMHDPLNAGIVSEVADGLARGRFRLQTVDAGIMVMMGTLQACFMRHDDEADGFWAVSMSQQLAALILRALGIDDPEADLIAAQEADAVLRSRAGRSGSNLDRLRAVEA